ncbi:patatin-like phospholipase family protein [Niabella beijingensis]|uniref:patatin-like phospholipase family protein n=1 Tax=Niabella beijingensis TaxID=2872700 RepID=UPI001CBE54EA|nr:patatin-like phospholipase family protein [Niabella beijingensis]MBZ4192645.1 patatin-like phospholipase family protein [Niabella beijingensis]
MEIRKATQSGKALVLGGGGATGNAWSIGVIAGLFDAGLDVRRADLIIGTSAGATVAAQITSTIRPPELLTSILAWAPRPGTAAAGKTGIANKQVNHIEITNRIISSAKDADDMRRKMGAALLETDKASRDSRQLQWRATVAARLPNQHWPEQRMLITAVNAHSSEAVVFDRHSGVDLADAVAASTAGGFAYSIGGNRYIDGGYRADVNADLAAGYQRVLVIAPLGTRTRKPLEWGLHLEAQINDLRAHGSLVETILPDSESQNAIGMGMDLMDLSRRRPSAQAGYNQGKAFAEEFTEFWC